MWVFSTAASEPTAPSGDFPSDGADRGTDTAQQKITSSREEKLFLLFCVQVFFYFWCKNKTVVIWQIENMLGNNDGREITGWWTEFYTNKPKNHRHKISCFIWLFPSTTWQPMGINLWSYWGSWPPGWEPITKLGNFIKCAEVCGCDVTGSIIWIPLMFSRCCSGRREINTRRKNTFTSKSVSTREGSTCRLTSLARLALQPLHFLAGVLCFTLLSRLWKHFRTPPDKPPRSAGVGGADRWGRKRMARKKRGI